MAMYSILFVVLRQGRPIINIWTIVWATLKAFKKIAMDGLLKLILFFRENKASRQLTRNVVLFSLKCLSLFMRNNENNTVSFMPQTQ